MMRTLRAALAVALCSTLLAGALHADRITYVKRAGGKVSIESIDGLTVTSWNSKEVSYSDADKKSGTVPRRDIVTLTRETSSSNALSEAAGMVGSDPAKAAARLAPLTGTGTALDKEEAQYLLAMLWAGEVSRDPGAATNATRELTKYLQSYKAGYFAALVYQELAALQRQAKKPDDARRTYQNMIGADASLARQGNQWLGELEADQGKWQAAITAFGAAKAAATRDGDKNGEYLAMAWDGWCNLKNNNAAGARATLEAVTGDEKFDDPASSDDEVALSVAYPALGDAYFEGGNFQKAYDAYIKGAYYSWWTSGNREGHCVGQAFLCAKKLEPTDEAKWKPRRENLRTVLALAYPRELQRVEAVK